MILLASTTDKLQIVTGQTGTIDVHASWMDNAAGTITPGRTNSNISTATTTDAVASPGAGAQRNVKTVHARNRGATAVDVTVQHTDGTTAVQLYKVTLAAGVTLQYIDEVGFFSTPAPYSNNQPGSTGPWTLINTLNASNSASLVFALTGGYRRYKLLWDGVIAASASTALYLQCSDDGGATWKTAANSYVWGIVYVLTGSTVASGGAQGAGASGADNGIRIAANADLSTSPGLNQGEVLISSPAQRFNVMFEAQAAAILRMAGAGYLNAALAAGGVTHIRLIMGTGNITSGSASLYGITS